MLITINSRNQYSMSSPRIVAQRFMRTCTPRVLRNYGSTYEKMGNSDGYAKQTEL